MDLHRAFSCCAGFIPDARSQVLVVPNALLKKVKSPYLEALWYHDTITKAISRSFDNNSVARRPQP
jgi:hypothetical protein